MFLSVAESAVKVSYVIANKIALASRPYCEGEFMKTYSTAEFFFFFFFPFVINIISIWAILELPLFIGYYGIIFLVRPTSDQMILLSELK